MILRTGMAFLLLVSFFFFFDFAFFFFGTRLLTLRNLRYVATRLSRSGLSPVPGPGER